MNANETSSRLKINPVFTADFSHREKKISDIFKMNHLKENLILKVKGSVHTILTDFYHIFTVLHIILSAHLFLTHSVTHYERYFTCILRLGI